MQRGTLPEPTVSAAHRHESVQADRRWLVVWTSLFIAWLALSGIARPAGIQSAARVAAPMRRIRFCTMSRSSSARTSSSSPGVPKACAVSKV